MRRGRQALDRSRFEDGALVLAAQGSGPANSSPLAFVAGDLGYQVTVGVELQGASQGGLLLFYDDKLFCGLGAEAEHLHAYKRSRLCGARARLTARLPEPKARETS